MLVNASEKWDHALGMIKVDGLEPSQEFIQLIEKENRGEMTMKVEYTSFRLAEFATENSASCFNFSAFCDACIKHC